MLRKLRQRLGIDGAVALTFLARAVNIIGSTGTVMLIARFLGNVEQGYYYTFGSLIALQIVFELGFSFVILQLASHERAHLTISSDYTVSGDSTAHDRLASVFQKTLRWYTTAAVLLAVFLLAAGTQFFSRNQHANEHVSWHFAWYAAALARRYR